MRPEVVSAAGMPPALGPYSHAVRLGDVLYISGQPGIDPASGAPPAGGFPAEARQAFENLKTVLEAAGSEMAKVARVTVFLADAEFFAQMNELFAEFFGGHKPTRSTPIVGLPRGLLISLDAIAAA